MPVPNITAQKLRFLLQTTPSFTPPAKVAALKDQVDIDLLVGAQVQWTNVNGRRGNPGYGMVHDWEAMTVPGNSPHRFYDSSIGEDSESSGDVSAEFSKLVSFAFMSEYAGATWYKVLKPLWGSALQTADGIINVAKKVPDDQGPDYLVAPFDPGNSTLGGPFYALEVKGRSQKIEFGHASFQSFSTQAANIKLTNAAGAAVNLKSWVNLFNYGFEQPLGSREESTLLVEDPEIAPGEPHLKASALNGASIIRDHLARQCFLLGAQGLRVPVLAGTGLEGVSNLPPVYSIDHPRLSERRYIGQWYSFAPSGELLPMPIADWHVRRRRPGHISLRSRHGDAEIFIHPDGPDSIGAIADVLGLRGTVFVGQDATMLRQCTQVPTTRPLDGKPFRDELHFIKPPSDDGKVLRVMRNGSVIASSRLVDLDADEFWSKSN